MSKTESMEIDAAGAIILDHRRRLLMVLRGRPPEQGRWSLPGGKCEPGERTVDACIRETAEETGLSVQIERLAGRVVRPAPEGDSYLIDDFVCQIIGGTLLAGDDAREVGWFSRTQLDQVLTVDLLIQTLGSWDLLPD